MTFHRLPSPSTTVHRLRAQVSPDVLVSYPRSAIAGRVAMVCVVLLSHPVVSYPVGPCLANMRATVGAACRHRRAGSRVARLEGADEEAGAKAQGARAQGDVADGGGAAERGPSSAGACAEAVREASTPALPAAPEESSTKALGGASAPSVFFTEREQVVTRALFLVVTTATALLVTDLGIVVSLAGAASATTVILIAPGACYYALHPHGRLRRGAAALCVLGCILLPCLVLLVLAAHGHLGHDWALEDAVEGAESSS